MKVGILTYHFVSNFGANLQTLSTYHNILKNGHEPLIINWVPKDLEEYYTKVVPANQNEAFHRFHANHYKHLSRICRTSRDIAAVVDEEHIDLVVIGSDAVLTYTPILSRLVLSRRGPRYVKPCIDSDFPNAFWGDFALSTKSPVKLAIMSGSAQNTNYKNIKFRKKQFQEALSRFSFISVRDIWTKKMLAFLTKDKLHVDITPDPVFAFNYNVEDQYSKEYILNRFNIEGDYALLTIDNKGVSLEWKKQLEASFAKRGIMLLELPQANKPCKYALERTIDFPIDPLEWYCLIKYATAYIGELMHPVLVSLHNAVPVYVLDTYGFKSSNSTYGIDLESSKTYQIMSRFGLLDYYSNVHALSKLDKPEVVVNKVLAFDKSYCSQKAAMMLEDYKVMMKTILN